MQGAGTGSESSLMAAFGTAVLFLGINFQTFHCWLSWVGFLFLFLVETLQQNILQLTIAPNKKRDFENIK
jgi:hypothetical protein